MATKITVTPEMTSAVNKTFAAKDAEGNPSEKRFKVVKLVDSFNFGPKAGGIQPQFIVHRLDAEGNGISEANPQAADFLKHHILVPEVAAAPAKA